jgi:predicted lactoylglutathione lyase
MTVIVSLPIADRRVAFDFYREVLRFEAVGPLADDGVPEPLTFGLADGVQLMLIPSDGFGWVVGDHQVAARGHTECLLDMSAAGPSEVREIVERARAAGARIVNEPGEVPWGYAALFADPDGHLWSVTDPAI